MDDAELTRLGRRFGDDASRRPAPHRRVAALHLSPDPGADAVLHAALMQPTDEAALAQAVLTRLAVGSVTAPRVRLARVPALAGYGALLLVFGGIGYDSNPGSGAGDPLLALAFGDALPALVAAP